jgi:hypothetical protein
MKWPAVIGFVFASVVLLDCGSSLAHHGNAAYDLDKSVTLKGTITAFEFSNPHV